MQGLKFDIYPRRAELFAECGEFSYGDGTRVGAEESGDIAQISGFAGRVIADGVQFQCDKVWQSGGLEFCRPALQGNAANMQFVKGRGIHKKHVHVRHKIRRVAVTGEVFRFDHPLEAAAAQVRVKRVTIFDGNKAIHIHGLACHTVCRKRVTADDKHWMRKADEKIEQSLHFPYSLAGNEAKRKRQSRGMN